jgi:MoaA/NifB/PqqE/SkfB family radical SAM enzyme
MSKSKFNSNYIPEIKAIVLGRSRPGMVSVNLTHKCNQNCIYCEIGKGSPEIPNVLLNKDDMIWIIDQMASEGMTRLSMCGGEPFLFPDLINIVEYAYSKNIRSNITSNGMTIHRLPAQQLKSLADCKCQVNISVDSFHSEIQSKTRGNQDALENALSSIKTLQKNRINVTILSAISKYNYTDLFDSIKEAYKLGVKEVLYQPIISVSNYPDRVKLERKENLNVPVSGMELLNAELDKILVFESRHNISTNVYRIKPWINEYIKSVYRENSKPFYLEVLKKFHCRETHAVIDISYTGGIQPCGLALSKSSIKERNNQTLIELWQHASADLKMQLENECFPDICMGCCHKFSRNMMGSVIKYPVINKHAAMIIFFLLSKRILNKTLKKFYSIDV